MLVLPVWILYALATSLAVGLFSFSTKITSDRKHDVQTSLILYYILTTLCASVLVIATGSGTFSFGSILLGLLTGSIYPINLFFRQKAFQYFEASTYMLLFRVIASILILIAGIVFFSDELTLFESIGFLLGFVVVYLLTDRVFQKSCAQTHSKRGWFYLGITVLVMLIAHVANNFYIDTDGFNAYDYYLVTSVVSLVIMALVMNRALSTKLKKVNKEYLAVAGVQASCASVSIPMFLFAIGSGGDLGIVYKVVSLSVVIPVILSILIYKESISSKKILAFILTLVSFWFFI